MTETPEELLTADEAAARLGVTRSYLYRLIKRGVLPEAVGIRNGREVKLIPASGLARLRAHEGLLVRDVGAGEPRGGREAEAAPPQADGRSVTGQWPDAADYTTLLNELRAELSSLRDQLAQERAARAALEEQMAKRASIAPAEEVAAVISRANEVTALVKASELKQTRILEELLASRRWGRAQKIAYGVYLALATIASIGAIIFVFQLAAQLKALAAR